MTGKTTKKAAKSPARSTSASAKGTAKKKKTTAKPAKASRRRTTRKSFSKLWLALLAFATGLTAMTLVWALNLSPVDNLVPSVASTPRQASSTPLSAAPSQSPPSTRPSSPAPTAKTPPPPPSSSRTEVARLAQPPATPNQVRAKVQGPASTASVPSQHQGRVYEIYDTEVLEQQVKEVDLALIQTIMSLNLDPRAVRHLDIQMKNRNGQKYHTQSLSIGLNGGADAFVQTLGQNLELWVEKAKLELIRTDVQKQEWRISLLNLPTHTLFLEEHSRPVPEPPRAVQPGAGPRLVVVIDDLGENLHQARELAALSFPVTFAVLPHSSKTREVALLGAKAGRDVLLHQPMEPLDYPHRADPGPGALFVGMSEEDILAVIQGNLAQIPQAIGMNNHMGSRFTADEQGMATVLRAVQEHELFFLDSLTTGDSVVQKQARKIGLTNLRRQIFLDNIQNVQAILFQLRKAEQLAHSTGEVIAIGHPYPETLEALKLWERERDARVAVVALSSLVSHRALAGR